MTLPPPLRPGDDDTDGVIGPWADLAAARKRRADALAARFRPATTPIHATARRSK